MGNEEITQDNGSSCIRAYVVVRGIVQGVGFRPFVHRLSIAHQLYGWVLNSTEGVEIEVEGSRLRIDAFLADLSGKAPPMASIHRIEVYHLPPAGYSSFIIGTSHEASSGFPLVSPDIATCPDCLSELFDDKDRRHRYPFINCTNCGPRFTIVEGVPYDRPKTTMKAFTMCPDCQKEYDDPGNRRFHAQPNACPECGPYLWLGDAITLSFTENLGSGCPHRAHPEGRAPALPSFSGRTGEGFPFSPGCPLGAEKGPEDEGTEALSSFVTPQQGMDDSHGEREPVSSRRLYAYGEAIDEAKRLLKSGKIVAVKGLGGFHLACDATNADAVRLLRARKRRVEKPFAIMVRDLETVAKLCHLSSAEAQLLSSARRPIVLLERRLHGPVAQEVAPGNKRLGVMLPYTPLHHLLLEPTQHTHFEALVMTSGNLSEEPIARDNDEAVARLAMLADYFLLHNRPIRVRCDDSVTQVFAGKEAIIRRSRGYAPLPMRLDFELEPVLACGPELKNTFCITRGNYAFLSQHIGDLENQETLDFFSETIGQFERIFNLGPSTIAHDLHPDYLSTRYALSRQASAPLAALGIQHHHAHVASCMAENGLNERVIGVAFDGTGYGLDGAAWGGEFLAADYLGFERVAHLTYVPLPGGQAAIKKPYRMALSYLMASYSGAMPEIDFLKDMDPAEIEVIKAQITRRINSPLTSSSGRLFDAVSALIGIRGEVTYEGQAAIELEMAADSSVVDAYRFGLSGGTPIQVDTAPVIRAIVDDLRKGEEREVIAAKFHNGVAWMIAEVCSILQHSANLSKVCLSGGVFQNRYLLVRTLAVLERQGFDVYTHHLVPCNDGGISLGQAIVASARMRSRNA